MDDAAQSRALNSMAIAFAAANVASSNTEYDLEVLGSELMARGYMMLSGVTSIEIAREQVGAMLRLFKEQVWAELRLLEMPPAGDAAN